jgi:hypothetical protein
MIFLKNHKKKKIGVFYICTGKYSIFWKAFFESAEKYFCKGEDIKYIVFTDQLIEPTNERVTIVYQEKMGWPFDTLKRFHLFEKANELVADREYLFFFNANMKFTSKVIAKQVLPTEEEELVGVIHPYYYEGTTGAPFESNRESEAYLESKDAKHYIQGCLNGGTRDAYMKMATELAAKVDKDLAKDIISIWWDESHLNLYFAKHGKYKTLDPGFSKPENRRGFPFKERIIQLDKEKHGGHAFLRT